MIQPIHIEDGQSWLEDGQGEALVFVHGVGGNLTAFAPQVAALSHGFRAISWSLPGYGGGDLAAPDAASYARRFLDFLAARSIARAHVVGHSMGAIVLAQAARLRPGLLLSFTMAQPVRGFAHLEAEARERLRMGRVEEVRRLGMQEFSRLRGASVLGPAATRDMAAAHLRMMAGIPEAAYLNAWDVICGSDLFALAPDLDCRVQILMGEADKVAPPDVCRALARLAPRGAEAHELDGVGHSAPVEAPDRLLDHLRRFLRGARA